MAGDANSVPLLKPVLVAVNLLIWEVPLLALARYKVPERSMAMPRSSSKLRLPAFTIFSTTSPLAVTP